VDKDAFFGYPFGNLFNVKQFFQLSLQKPATTMDMIKKIVGKEKGIVLLIDYGVCVFHSVFFLFLFLLFYLFFVI